MKRTRMLGIGMVLLCGLGCASADGAESAGDAGVISEDAAGTFLDPNEPDPDPENDTDETDEDDGINPADEGPGDPTGDAGPLAGAMDPPTDEIESMVDVPSEETALLPPPPPGDEVSSGAIGDGGLDVHGSLTAACAGSCGRHWVCARAVSNASTGATARYSVVFSRRGTDNGSDNAIEDAYVGAIGRATPGSTLRLAMFSFSRHRVAVALVNASRCGVNVRVILDGRQRTTRGSEAGFLERHLPVGSVIVCGDGVGRSCLGDGIMHDKFLTITAPDARTAALNDGSSAFVGVASHNLTASQRRLHNNMVLIRNDPGMLAGYNRTFDLMADPVERALRINRHRVETGEHSHAYFFPRTDGQDTVLNVLSNVQCDSTSRIYVAMAFFTNSRLPVATALRALQSQGCRVRVVVGNAAIPVGSMVMSTLRGGTNPVRVWRYPWRSGRWGLHSKYLLIDAPYLGSNTHHRMVFTGSHNWTPHALTNNDENMLRVERTNVFNAFLADWVRVRDASQRH